jgi:hypothetical protein
MPNKSDYYSKMSPVTLSPQTVNPWRNPMKTGIVSPAYNAADTVTYKYGASANIGASLATAAEFNWDSFDGTIGDVAGCHFGVFVHWDVQPGPKVITGFSNRGAFLQADHIDSYAIDVWKNGTTDLTLVATTGAIAADAGSTGSMILAKTLATPLSVTLVAGEKYYVGIRVIRKASGVGYPYVTLRTTTYTCVQDNFAFSCIPAAWNGTTISKTSVAAEHNFIDSVKTNVTGFSVTYTSTNYLEQSLTAADYTNKTLLLATPVTAPYVVKLTGLVVGDNKEFFATFRDLGSDMLYRDIDVMQFDAGVTEDNVDHILLATKDASLPLLGAARQAGRSFDMIFGIRPQGDNTIDYDLYWQCRTAETSLHSHAVQVGGTPGTRGQLYTYSTTTAAFRLLTISGDYNSMTSIQVGTRPMVIIGDSQAISGSGTSTIRTPNLDRWGALPTTLAKPRIWIMHGGSGEYLGYSVASVKSAVFNHATPGSGDGRELLGLGCDWWLAGMGINDLNVLVAAPAAATATTVDNAAATVLGYVTDFAEIISAAGERMILTGLPPFSLAGYGAESEFYADAVRAYNRGLLGLALAWQVPFYNPWFDMVDKTTLALAMPKWIAAYGLQSESAAGECQHYGALPTGGAVLTVPAMVRCIESSTIDLRDAWD